MHVGDMQCSCAVSQPVIQDHGIVIARIQNITLVRTMSTTRIIGRKYYFFNMSTAHLHCEIDLLLGSIGLFFLCLLLFSSSAVLILSFKVATAVGSNMTKPATFVTLGFPNHLQLSVV